MIRWLDDTLRELVDEYLYAAVFLACLLILASGVGAGLFRYELEHFR